MDKAVPYIQGTSRSKAKKQRLIRRCCVAQMNTCNMYFCKAWAVFLWCLIKLQLNRIISSSTTVHDMHADSLLHMYTAYDQLLHVHV